MNNIELEAKVKELIEIENYFDAILAVKEFEPEYKKSDFFKATKMPLDRVVREAKVHYLVNIKNLQEKFNEMVDGLDAEKFLSVIDQIGSLFSAENEAIREQVQSLNMSELLKTIK